MNITCSTPLNLDYIIMITLITCGLCCYLSGHILRFVILLHFLLFSLLLFSTALFTSVEEWLGEILCYFEENHCTKLRTLRACAYLVCAWC